jgi:general nucleoside transport system ATP-binding protein
MQDASQLGSAARTQPILRAVGVSKRYGEFFANDGIDLDLYPAEIHALLGENGAGKSTLVKIMYGLIQPSAGELRWMGQGIVLHGPAQARELGIAMVFQHFSLFEKALAQNAGNAVRRQWGRGR